MILLLCSTAVSGNSAVVMLTKQMGNTRYADRERATAALYKMMPQAESYLKDVRQYPDKEISIRAGLLLSRYYREQSHIWADKILPEKYNRMPWIDKLPLNVPDREDVMRMYLNMANRSKDLPSSQAGWQVYRFATKLYVKDLIESGRTREEIVQLLNEMAKVEIEWIRKYGHQYNPPIELPK